MLRPWQNKDMQTKEQLILPRFPPTSEKGSQQLSPISVLREEELSEWTAQRELDLWVTFHAYSWFKRLDANSKTEPGSADGCQEDEVTQQQSRMLRNGDGCG